jgi:hypothetical protein
MHISLSDVGLPEAFTFERWAGPLYRGRPWLAKRCCQLDRPNGRSRILWPTGCGRLGICEGPRTDVRFLNGGDARKRHGLTAKESAARSSRWPVLPVDLL